MAPASPTKFIGAMAPASPTKSSSGSSTAASEADQKLNHLVQAQLSKTKMCGMFIRGTCPDAKCRFAHSSEELRKAPDLTKTAICRAFARGSCAKGRECPFAHGEQDLRVTPTVYKTQLCNFHDRGHCKKGDNCRHAHGRDQLRAFQGDNNGKQRSNPQEGPRIAAERPRCEKGSGARTKVNRSAGAPAHGHASKSHSILSPGGAEWNSQSAAPIALTLKQFSAPAGDFWPVIQEQMPDAYEPMKIDLQSFNAQPLVPLFAPFADPPFPNAGEGARAFMAARAIEAAQVAQKHKAACEQASAAAACFAAAASEAGMFGLSDTDRDFESILGSLTLSPMRVGGGVNGMQGCAYGQEPGLEHQYASVGSSWVR